MTAHIGTRRHEGSSLSDSYGRPQLVNVLRRAEIACVVAASARPGDLGICAEITDPLGLKLVQQPRHDYAGYPNLLSTLEAVGPDVFLVVSGHDSLPVGGQVFSLPVDS